MVVVSIALVYGVVVGTMFGFAIGRYRDDLQAMKMGEKFFVALAIVFWPITLVLVGVPRLLRGDQDVC